MFDRYIDISYINRFSSRLSRYKITNQSPFKANFRCIYCGDSKKSEKKARGWILEKDNNFFYYCHNCSAAHPFWAVLKQYDPSLYKEYVVEKFIEKTKTNSKPVKDSIPKSSENDLKNSKWLTMLTKVSEKDSDHPVIEYLKKRKIPKSVYNQIYYTAKFNSWVNKIIPNKLNTDKDEPRLIFPFSDKDGNMFGFSGRSFSKKSTLRYITIMIDESKPKIYGLDKIDFSKPYCVVEGPIDSLFLENAIAMAGASLHLNSLENIENAIFVFDNEPRNEEIHGQMKKIIDLGYKICIWPSWLKEKDINDMVLSGHDPKKIIDDHTYEGLMAFTKLTEWRKR